MAKNIPPPARNPRPKGAQRGVAARGNQNGPLNFGYGLRARESSAGCLMALALLPAVAVASAFRKGGR